MNDKKLPPEQELRLLLALLGLTEALGGGFTKPTNRPVPIPTGIDKDEPEFFTTESKDEARKEIRRIMKL